MKNPLGVPIGEKKTAVSENIGSIVSRVLCCPGCRCSLDALESEYRCPQCRGHYPIQKGIIVFRPPEEHSEFYKIEAAFHDEKFGAFDLQKLIQEKRCFSYQFPSVRKFVPLQPGSLALEVGCGARADGTELAREGVYVLESDISLTAVEKAKAICAEEGVETFSGFVVCSGDDLPFCDGAFDLVFAVASFHHMPDALRCLQAMARVVRKGGRVVLAIEPNRWPFYLLVPIRKPLRFISRKLNPRKFNSIADDLTNGFAKRQWHTLASKSGLGIISIERAVYTLQIYLMGFLALQKLFHLRMQPDPATCRKLFHFDQKLKRIPGIHWLNWQWNCVFSRE